MHIQIQYIYRYSAYTDTVHIQIQCIYRYSAYTDTVHIQIQYIYRYSTYTDQQSSVVSHCVRSVIVSLRAWADQVSKAGRPACASEAFTVSGHLKCGLPRGLLPLAILENITVFGRRTSSMASNLVALAMVRLFRRTQSDAMPKL